MPTHLAHARRKFFDLHAANKSQIAGFALEQLAKVYDIEREVKELRRANEILKLASAFFAQAELDRRLKS